MARKSKKADSALMAGPAYGQEIATIGNGRDITRAYTGPLLVPFDSILNSRGGGSLELYESVYSDSQVQSVFSQRQLAVIQCEWKVESASDAAIDVKAAQFLEEQLQGIGWDRVTRLMLFGVFYGYSVAEVMYERQGNLVGLKQIKVRDRKRFRFDPDANLRLLTMQNMFDGELVEAPYFWHFATGADHDDEPYGRGLAHWLYWPVFFKRHGLKSWLTFLEKFAVPTSVGKYDPNTASPQDKRNLLMSGAALGTDAAVILPKDMELELLEAARSGTSDYKAMHDAMDATMAKVVLGQTASSQGTPGRLGNDELQGDVRKDLIKADADLICESFNLGPAEWLTAWNFPSAQPPRVVRVVDEPEDLEAHARRDELIARATGYRPTLHMVTEHGGDWEEKTAPALPFGFNEAAGDTGGVDDKKLANKKPAQFAAPVAGLDPSQATLMGHQIRLDNAIDSIPAELLEKLVNPMIAPVVTALRNGQSDEEAAQILVDVVPGMDDSAFAENLANAIFVADLWGQLSTQVLNGTDA